MVILERTPPRRWHATPEQESGPGRAEEVVEDDGYAGAAVACTKPTTLEQSFVFPPLEAMAVPARERNVVQQPDSIRAAAAAAASSTGSANVSPAVVRKTAAPPLSASSTAHRPSPQPPSQLPVRTAQPFGSPRRPTASPASVRKGSPSNTSTKLSPSKQPARQAAVDEAFQAQIERAMASGENPFMDRRRAAMRDDSNASMSTPQPDERHAAIEQRNSDPMAATWRTVDRPKSAEASTSRVQLSDETQGHHLPCRSQEEVRRAAAVVRRSLLADTEAQAGHTVIDQGTTSPRQRTQTPVAAPISPPRPPSPPLVLFTPQRKTLSSEPQIIPLAQQEEAHRLRAEARESKTRLRNAQMDVERLQQEVRTWQAHHEEEQRKVNALQARLSQMQDESLADRTALRAAQFEDARRVLEERMVMEEQKRQMEIDAVIARNEITYLNARRLEAEEALQEIKDKQHDKGSAVRQELEVLRQEMDEVQMQKKQMAARLKQKERDHAESEEQIESLQEIVARETARRKEIASREMALREELEELQDTVSREVQTRKEVVELRVALAAEKEKVNELRRTAIAAPHKSFSSSSPRKPKATVSTSATRQDSRRCMQNEADSSLEKSMRLLNPPPVRKAVKSSVAQADRRAKPAAKPKGKHYRELVELNSDDSAAENDVEEGMAHEPSPAPRKQDKQRPAPRPAVKSTTTKQQRKQEKGPEVVVEEDRIEEDDNGIAPSSPPPEKAVKAVNSSTATKTNTAVVKAPVTKKTAGAIMARDGKKVEQQLPSAPSPARLQRSSGTRKPVDQLIRAAEKADPLEQQSITTLIPQKKKSTSTSLLAKTRDTAKRPGTAIASRRREPTDGDSSRATASSGAVAKAAKPALPTAVYDETMKTPLLPTKRTRVLQDRQAEPMHEDDDEVDVSVTEAARHPTSGKSGAARSSGVGGKVLSTSSSDAAAHTVADGAATPFVAAEPKKKKRKLLKAGSNVAGDFLTWKGDPDGGLNPQLNLPMELSPLKPGEQAQQQGQAIGGGGAAAAKSRFGIGVGVAMAGAGAQLFGRNK